MLLSNQTLATGDLGASFDSAPFRIESQVYTAIQAVWTGTLPIGVLKVQASNDQGTDNVGTGVTNWSDIPASGSLNPATVSVSGASGNGLFEIREAGYKWIRVVYTRTSGTGSIAITINAKGF